MQDFEKLGAFYLGHLYDFAAGKSLDDILLYDAKDLTTHAMCVGMTGSGKTGLCLSLLEEAAIDGIPAIAIDPKGDLGNLLLSFPELKPADFQPWIEPGEAVRAGVSVDEYAKQVAEKWQSGLKASGQDGARIARFREAVDVRIYTPGSNSGLPLTVLRSFDAPAKAIVDNVDAFRERILTAVSGLLALLGIEADPIRSREHILLSNIFDRAWRAGRGLDLSALIREIQQPPFDKIGVIELETLFPASERFALSMQINNLLASPSFSGWMEGEPLDVQRLLYTSTGKPRLSIISIAHLSDAERMFFVTVLLNEVVSWMRSQSGTSSLRALLYMDEVFGFFPPIANPPSKQPMLTLLKQARAFGLGIVLATQNPVDVDYKGLANCGTWFLGRLQTEQDKNRVLDGLEGASAAAGKSLDRQAMAQILSGLGNRKFLMNNVHEDAPVVFQTRWLLSYLRGPLTRDQIEKLMRPLKAAEPSAEIPKPAETLSAVSGQRPVVPPGIDELIFDVRKTIPDGHKVVYRPAIYGLAKMHYVQASSGLDEWRTTVVLKTQDADVSDDIWEEAEFISPDDIEIANAPESAAEFASAPAALLNPKNYSAWKTALKNHLYRSRPLKLYECAALKEHSNPDESEGDFRVRLRNKANELRDLDIEKLRKKYSPKLLTLQDRLKRKEVAMEREKSQASQQTLQTALNVGTTLLGALFGRKMVSSTSMTRAASSVRSASKIAKERSDIGHAQESVEAVQQQLADLEAEFEEESNRVKERLSDNNLELTEVEITPRKSDIGVDKIALAWTPWTVAPTGIAERAY